VQQPTARDADVVADGDGKRINDVAGLRVEVLQVLAQRQKQGFKRFMQAVQLAREPALIQCFHAPMLVHIAAASRQVAPEKTRRQQGRGQDFRVGQVPPVRGLRAAQT
jgi:hypothetical protein